jgi:N4-gp56 family major capsid protein
MSDAYTGTSALSNVVLGAVDQYVRASLRHTPMWRTICDTRPVNVDRAGSSVKLFTQSDLAVATTPLSELTDPEVVALPNPTSVTLTPNEYGNISVTSIKAKTTSFADIDPMQMNLIAYNLRDTMDALVSVVANGGTNVIYSDAGDAGVNNSTDDLAATDILTPTDVRKVVTKLRGAAAAGKIGDLYAAYIHPDVSADLRSQTGVGSWQDLHKYAAPGEFWPGTVGVFEGAAFIESARTKTALDGATSAKVYRTIFAGQEAIAEGVVVEPHTVVGNIPDKFGRFFPLGWYGFLGWTRFREAALYRVESGSGFAA